MKYLNKTILVAVMLLFISGNAIAETTPTMTDAKAVKIIEAWKQKPRNPYAEYDAKHGTNSYDAYMFDKKVRAEADQSEAGIITEPVKEQTK